MLIKTKTNSLQKAFWQIVVRIKILKANYLGSKIQGQQEDLMIRKTKFYIRLSAFMTFYLFNLKKLFNNKTKIINFVKMCKTMKLLINFSVKVTMKLTYK